MCLSTLWTKEQKKEWLEDKPEIIIAYKVVRIKTTSDGEDRIYPVSYHKDVPFEKINKLEKKAGYEEIETEEEDGCYLPYFHFFTSLHGARTWLIAQHSEVIFECEIPKKAITMMGIQEGESIIVATEFTFVEGDEYFKESS